MSKLIDGFVILTVEIDAHASSQYFSFDTLYSTQFPNACPEKAAHSNSRFRGFSSCQRIRRIAKLAGIPRSWGNGRSRRPFIAYDMEC